MSAKAVKLPSGSWRCRAWYTTDGKQHCKSFTSPSKREAERLAAEWLATRPEEKSVFSVHAAMRQYIDTCRLTGASPSTIRGYESLYHSAFPSLHDHDANTLTLADIQAAINTAAADHSPKTIRNMLSLLMSSLDPLDTGLNFKKLRLPSSRRQEVQIPTDDEIRKLLAGSLEMRDTDMHTAILLAAFMGMRRSEICALTWADVDFKAGTISVNKARVVDEFAEYQIKDTKTASGRRVLPIPDAVIGHLRPLRGLPSVRLIT